MMLKVNDEFLDFNGIVELDQQVKLFEEIDSTMGDFSYVFNLSKTSKNMRILGNPMPDLSNKLIYQSVQCDLLDDSGFLLHKGLLRVERINTYIECSFFSGNYNWISLLTGNLSDVDLSDYDTVMDISNISSSWQNTEGITFPLVDSGPLISRSYRSLMVEDFTGCIFVKTLFNKIFQSVGVKLNGDLFKDPVFDNLLMSRSTIGADDIKNASTFAKKTSNQQASQVATFGRLLFQDDFNQPYFDGENDNYDNIIGRYTTSVPMRLMIDLSLIYSESHVTVIPNAQIHIIKNGVDTLVEHILELSVSKTENASYEIRLDSGDYVEIWIFYDAGFNGVLIFYAGSTVKYKPTFIYFTSGKSLVPAWTQAQFVNSVISLFCCICDYEPFSKTLTIDFFENIKQKNPIDLSTGINVIETDFEEFISSFAQRNTLNYQEGDEDEIKEYNVKEYIKYGSGEINVSNDYIDKTGEMLESDFTAPISYVNNSFYTSLERLNLLGLEEISTQEFSTVSDLGGLAQFNVVDSTIYEAGELVRVSNSSQPSYNGDYLVAAVSPGFITLSLIFFQSDASGEITKLRHVRTGNDAVYLLINTKYHTNNVSNYSTFNNFIINGDQYTDVGYAFFNLLNMGLPINSMYSQGLSFGSVNDPLFYQRTIIEKYWGNVTRVLNDPVKLRCEGTIPKVLFNNITPLQPVTIKTVESSNLYYLNKISGYTDSAVKCSIELIKLS